MPAIGIQKIELARLAWELEKRGHKIRQYEMLAIMTDIPLAEPPYRKGTILVRRIGTGPLHVYSVQNWMSRFLADLDAGRVACSRSNGA